MTVLNLLNSSEGGGEELSTYFEDTTMEMITEGGGGGTVYTKRNDYQGLVLGTSVVIIIILTNAVSLLAFIVEKRLRTYNNYFIINLVMADLLLGIGQTVGAAHTFLGYFPLNQTGCRIYLAIRNALFFVSVLGVLVICIDRHRATYDPINHFMSRSKRKAVVLNLVTWVIALGFWLSFGTAWDFIVDIDNGRHCVAANSRNTIANLVQNSLNFFVPFIIISVLYLRIFIKIKATVGGKNVSKQFNDRVGYGRGGGARVTGGIDGEISSGTASNATSVVDMVDLAADDMKLEIKGGGGGGIGQAITHGPQNGVATSGEGKIGRGDGGPKRESALEMRKATRTLSYIVLSFFVTWLPNSIIYFLYAIDARFISNDKLPPDLRQFFVWFRYSNSLLNPICYAASQPLFRQTVVDLLCRPCQYCCARCKN